jgi:hypothetical protein
VTCALFGATAMIGTLAVHTGERGGRRGDRVPQLAASHALGGAIGVQGDQRRGFVVVRQPAQQGFGVVQPQVGEEARRLNVVADEHRVRAARPGQLGPVKYGAPEQFRLVDGQGEQVRGPAKGMPGRLLAQRAKGSQLRCGRHVCPPTRKLQKPSG